MIEKESPLFLTIDDASIFSGRSRSVTFHLAAFGDCIRLIAVTRVFDLPAL
jgi:hypothetical protein